MSNWTHPICFHCYQKRYPYRVPIPFTEYGEEKCCDCGSVNNDGIYIRADPKHVNHPKAEE